MSADALARLERAEAAYRSAIDERRSAIIDAYRCGCTLNDIAAALGTTHEVPRRIVRAAGL